MWRGRGFRGETGVWKPNIMVRLRLQELQFPLPYLVLYAKELGVAKPRAFQGPWERNILQFNGYVFLLFCCKKKSTPLPQKPNILKIIYIFLRGRNYPRLPPTPSNKPLRVLYITWRYSYSGPGVPIWNGSGFAALLGETSGNWKMLKVIFSELDCSCPVSLLLTGDI